MNATQLPLGGIFIKFIQNKVEINRILVAKVNRMWYTVKNRSGGLYL